MIQHQNVEGTGERPLYEAEMFAKADGEAQRIFPVNPSAHIHKATHYIMGRKAGEFVRCLGIVRAGPSSWLKAPGASLAWSANGDGLGWWGGGGAGPTCRGAVLLSQSPGKRAVLSRVRERVRAPRYHHLGRPDVGRVLRGPHAQTGPKPHLWAKEIMCHPPGCAAFPPK